jgi:hypothetical protein
LPNGFYICLLPAPKPKTKKAMNRILSALLTTTCLLAMGFGCGRDCPEVEIPLNQELTAILRVNCRIRNQDKSSLGQMRYVVPGLGSANDVTEYVINSREELALWAACDPEALDAVDFDRYTVIAGQKVTTGNRFVDQSLSLRCDRVHYRLVFSRIHPNDIPLLDYFAVVPKLPGRPTIVYEIE